MDGQNFEPFLDWEAIDDPMVSDLHAQILAYEAAKNAFVQYPSKKTAAAILKPQYELSNIMTAIYSTIWTVPVMVHIAGIKQHEKDDDEDDLVIQRCKRCGSTLQMWREGGAVMTPTGPMALDEEDLPWWDEGDLVAKATGPGSMTMYQLPQGHELEKHERPCPDFAGELG